MEPFHIDADLLLLLQKIYCQLALFSSTDKTVDELDYLLLH